MRLPTLPVRLTGATVRRLRRAGDAARDAGRWAVAAALYEQALALHPGDARLHIQCGHMCKEAGDFAAAERHYELAQRRLPADADLALQQGHLFKTAGAPERAEAAYARALTLQPGWTDAARELALLVGHGPTDAADVPLPGLLPQAAAPTRTVRDGLVLARLGRPARPGEPLPTLSGVEAVRGHIVAHSGLGELTLLVAGEEHHRGPLAPVPDQPAKHPFNLWIDLSALPPGEVVVELRWTDRRGRVRAHRLARQVVAPDPTPSSDAWVPPPVPGQSVELVVDALPSLARPARRRVLPTTPATILVQRLDQLGDLACSVAAVRALRALYPQARLIGLLSPANEGLAHALELFDQVVVADFTERHGRRAMAAAEQRRLRALLAPLAIDLAIDLAEGGASRPVLRLSGARTLCGFGRREFPWLHVALDVAAPDPVGGGETIPHARKLRLLVDALRVADDAAAPVIPRAPDPHAADLREAIGLPPGRPYLLFHTGARLAFSRWPGFAALTRLVLAQTDWPILLMHDDPAGLSLDVVDDPRLRILGGRLPFVEFDALVAGAAAFVGNDSGPKHLAALRGVPVVSLHSARIGWSEWGQEQTGIILTRRVPCAGCGISDQPDECGRGFPCIRLIRPEEVLAALLSLLDRAPAPDSAA